MVEYKIRKKENGKYVILILQKNLLGLTHWGEKKRLGTKEPIEFDTAWDAKKYARRMNGIGDK